MVLTSAGNPYTAATVTIEAGVTVEAEPGVHIVGTGEFSRIFVSGTLKAEGTTESPIVFTSANSEKAGEWRGLVFEPGSGASVLNRTEVAYGGHLAVPMIEVNGSSPSILNSTLRKSAQEAIAMTAGGSPDIGGNTVIGGSAAVPDIKYLAPKETTGEINIHGNHIEGGRGSGISATVESGATVTGKTLGGNTVIGTEGTGIYYTGSDIPTDITENTLSGNKYNRISVEGTVAHSATWNVSPGGTPLWLPKAVTVASGIALSVNPGFQILGGDEFSRIFVKGTLKAEGTEKDPVTFTAAFEKAGEWRGLVFEPGSGGSVLNHVEVAYGGHLGVPMIEINASSPSILNSTLRKSAQEAIAVTAGGSPDIGGNTIFGGTAAVPDIKYSAGKETSGEINIHGNTIEGGGGSGISATVESGASITGKTLSANMVIGTEGTGIYYTGSDIPTDITENTLSGNKYNRISVEGTVANSSTWNVSPGGTPLWLPNTVTVASGKTLTVNPGVQILGGDEFSRIFAIGTLNAEGTEKEPIIFTSGNKKEPGQWRGLVFEPGSGSSVLNHVEVAYGGHLGVPMIEVNGSSPSVLNSTLRKSSNQAIYAPKGGAPNIGGNTVIENNASSTAIQYTAPKETSGEINIHGNYVKGGSAGITATVESGASVTGKTLSANTVVGTGGTGVSYTGSDIPGDITENTLSANKYNRISVEGSVAHSSTWNVSPGGTPLWLANTVSVASGVTLTVNPGVRIIGGGEFSRIFVSGTLKAEGTEKEPILFTSANSEKAGEWRGLVFEPGSGGSVLNHVQVVYGGHLGVPMIEINGSSPTILNSTLGKSSNQAIYATKGGAPNIGGNIILGNGASAANIQYKAPKETTGEINIHGNYIEGGGSGITATVESGATVTGKALSGNTVIGTAGTGIVYTGSDIPTDITENTLAANKFNRISVEGTVAHSSTWNPSSGGTPLWLPNTVSVASGVTLTVSPGVRVIGGDEFSRIFVSGTLKAEGTEKELITFTSASSKEAGEWRGLVFEPGSSSSVLNRVEVAYGGHLGKAMIEINGSSPTILNSTLRQSANQAIKATGASAPRIEWNRLRSNSSGVANSGTKTFGAPNNDWGCASGPKPAGCGDSVTSNVSWKPAVELPEQGGPCRGKENQCGEGADPVSLPTGQLNYSHRDLLLTNKSSIPLEFIRAYNSGNATDTGLGPGWSQTGLASAMELASGEVLALRQDGRQDVFYKTETGYRAPSGVTDVLTKVEGTFQLTMLDRTVYRFDSSGRIVSITDDHGLKTTYAYNAEGRLATITDPSGQTLTFSYNASNHITLVKDSTGREVKFAYSAAGDLEAVTDALGGITKYTYDSQHRITQITDPRSNVILKNTYDSQGRITEQRDGMEGLWKLAYGSGETMVTEPGGGKITYGFDGQSRVVSENDQLGNKTTTVYDSAGNVGEVIRPGGAKWSFGHDSAGNLISVKDPEGGERKYEYDSKNRLTKFTDARGNSWSYEWSAANDLTKITDPEGGETTLTYNESGQPLTLTDADKHKAERTWDSRGNQLSATDPLGHKTSFEYNSRSYLTSRTKPGLKAESFERDALGDILAHTTPEGHKTKYAYDANGLPTQITDPAEGVWKIAYNAMERPITYTDPAEQQATVAYNGNLRPTKVTNRRGKETTYGYDLANRLTEVHAPEGGNWTFGYDARGNRTSIVDPRENKTTYEYDLLDRMKKASEPLEATTEYGYDATGDLTSVKDPRGNTTSYGYDKLGRLAEVKQPLEKTTSFAYDGVGNMLSRATALGTVGYGYDAANRLTKVSSGESTLRSFAYDAANRLTEATDSEGHKIGIGYTEEGRVASMNDGRGQSLTRAYNSRGQLTKQVDGRGTLEYGYDKLGRLTSLTDPQGKASSFAYDPEGDLTEVKRPGGIVTTNLYDNAGRLSEGTTKAGEPPAVLEALKYNYDPAGDLLKRIDSRLEQEHTYAYDALSRLTEFNPPGEGATSYGYDAAGNRTEASGTTYTYNALNQLTGSSNGTTYGYDSAGRLTNEANESEETTYTWDPLDHLAKVEGPSETASYSYDALERLSEHASEAGTQVFHNGDLGDLATFDTNGKGEPTTSYVQGAHGLLEQRSGETTSYPLADAHGDITAIVDGTGEVTSRQSYGPWGAQLSGPSLEMGFLGAQERRAGPATGLIQMGARSYDPAQGRFLSEDPVYGHLGIGASVDRYLYVWDNPLNRYDLNGRDVCAPTPWGDACAGDAAEDAGNAASEAWETGKELVTHPGESATNAVEYWAGSESPASYVFGPLSVLGDMAINPDRAAYYLEKANPAQMAATGILVAGSAGLIVVTAEATADCLAVTAGIEAVHVCGQVAAFGGGLAATGGVLAVEVAKR